MEDQILRLLEAAGGALPRREILSGLGLPGGRLTSEYWTAERRLADHGRIERRRGRGGGIFLVGSGGVDEESPEEEPAPIAADEIPEPDDKQFSEQVVEDRRAEKSHYKPAMAVLQGDWAKDERFIFVCGAITAGQGRRKTGGRWTRPDLTLLCASKRVFDAQIQGDVRTFEVKLFDALNVSAVFEALSHRSRSHYAYLLVVDLPDEETGEVKARLESVKAEAARHGVGMWTTRDTSDYSTWELELDARRSDADPIAIEDFVTNQVPPTERERFSEALKGAVGKVSG